VNVANAVTSIDVTGVANHDSATVTGNVKDMPLEVGDNVIDITVTAEDGTTVKVYTVTIHRVSNDATLRSLTVSSGDLSFDANTTSYTVNVANGVTNIDVTGTANHDSATVTGNVTDMPLEVGDNVTDITVTAEDGTTVKVYTVTVHRISNDATLRSLTVSSGDLSFDANTTSYTVNVANGVTNIDVTGVANHDSATVTGNVTDMPLEIGDNVTDITVTAEDGTTTKVYTVTVHRISNDATLRSLTVSSGDLSFDANTTSYTVNVANDVTSIDITGTANHDSATITGNVTDMPLEIGDNVIDITGNAEDGTTVQVYTVTIHRVSNDATLRSLTVSSGDLSFDANTTSYAVNVANAVTSIDVTGTANHDSATVTGNVTDMPLEVGANNMVTITVAAEDGTTTGTYTVTINRSSESVQLSSDATLKSLAISAGTLTPAFNANTTDYTVNVANDVTAINVTGVANHPEATVSGNVTGKTLEVGDNNVVSITVAAENGTTTVTYTVRIVRAPAADATLKSLTVSSGDLSPAFDANTTGYTVRVANSVTNIDVTGTANHAAATVSGNVTGKLLEVGSNNVVNITVTAEDGTTRTYTVTIHRVSSDATLKSLTLSAVTLPFDANTTDYTVDVANEVTNIDVTGVANHAAARVSGNVTGKPLATGASEVTITVTAEDGITVLVYTVTITRALSSDARLSSLRLSSGNLPFDANTTDYTIRVNSDVANIDITGVANHPAATVSGNVTGMPLETGDNTADITVRAEDGTTLTYTLTIRRLSADATLSSLTLSSGTLEFEANTTSYTVTVSNEITSIDVTGIANHALATVSGNVQGMSLKVGASEVKIKVVAEDGIATATYTVTVVRSDHVFVTEANLINVAVNNKEITVDGYNINYAAPCGETSFVLDLDASPYSTVTIDGVEYSGGQRIELDGDLTANIRIEAETGGAASNYTLNVTSSLNDSKLYYQRWDDVLAINLNPANNGGRDVSGIRWHKDDGTPVGEKSYIEVQPGSTAAGYYAEILVEGKWRQVCNATEMTIEGVVAYPNPVMRGESIRLELPETFAGGVLNIYDMKGVLVKSGLPLPATNNSIDVSSLSSGVYLLNIHGKDGKRHTVKIIIE
jgi:hypothetical protein